MNERQVKMGLPVDGSTVMNQMVRQDLVVNGEADKAVYPFAVVKHLHDGKHFVMGQAKWKWAAHLLLELETPWLNPGTRLEVVDLS